MGPITNADLDTDAAMLIDFQQAGAPLVISFGFYDANQQPQFNFYGRLKKLELLSGQPLNKILLRDPSQSWYLHGIAGVGTDVDTTVRALRTQIDRMAPAQVFTLGQSMGGYAAVLYGLLLEVDKVLSFGTLSCFDGRLWELMNDQRWEPPRRAVAAVQPAHPYHDLPPLIRAHTGRRPAMELFYGTYPGAGALRSEAVGYDAVHALRFDGVPGVTLFPAHHAPHAIVEYFRSHGVITELLANRLLGTPLLPLIAQWEGETAWASWLLENLARGCSAEQLRTTMIENQCPPESADQWIARSFLLQTLRDIVQRSGPGAL